MNNEWENALKTHKTKNNFKKHIKTGAVQEFDLYLVCLICIDDNVS